MSTRRVIGAGRVVRVQGRVHEVTGERGLDRDARGLDVADLTDHHDVRVLAQQVAQPLRERQALLLVDLDLADALELVLDRILQRDHVELPSS